MRVLLDTQVFLWWNEGNAQLSKTARKIMADPANALVLSVASAWEIAIKVQLGKLRIQGYTSTYVETRAAHGHLEILQIHLRHAAAVASLPLLHHRDPFDRMLVVQSQIEKLPILSADPAMKGYLIDTIW